MLPILLGLLGVGAVGAAGGGGGGSSKSKAPHVIEAHHPPVEPDPEPVEQPDHNDDVVHDDHDDDVVEGDDDPVNHGDDTMHAGGDDHMDDGNDTMHAGGDDHMDHGDDTMHGGSDDDHMNHGDHGDDFVAITAPQTEAEIDDFVAAVMAASEMHVHDASSSKTGEHMAAMDLVPRDEITHIAIGHGDWDDPANWYNGEVPGDDARVLIPEGIHMTYDHVNEARLFTVRVDGKLEFSTETNSQMIVDTLVISPSGHLEIGTQGNPVDPNVNVDIIFANNGPIDTTWDPMLLSRGMIAHGNVEIHGAAKDSHDKVVEDPMAGDTWVDMGETPEGWAVGDTIVIAGTRYDGYLKWDPEAGYAPPQDEIRVITDISDGMIFFDEPLEFDHDTPREDLKTSVANYTRNISFGTENAEFAEVYERGHVMFMHNDDVDVRYAEFHELGRTDKSEDAVNVGDILQTDFDTNVKGRYSFHFHRAGTDDDGDPGISVGNAVFGSPGWGFVHHDSYAIFENNATYDTFGAGYVAESGNEIGSWTDNIAIFAQGLSWKDPKLGGNNVATFDLGRTGDGFWFQGRMVESIDNVAASVNNGFIYFHRGGTGDDRQVRFDAEDSDLPASVFAYDETVGPSQHPIISFDGNETFASRAGLYVLKANPIQTHDVHTVMEDFTAWSVARGAIFSYTGHYTLKDFDLVGREASDLRQDADIGIVFGGNTLDMTALNVNIEGFDSGFLLHKSFTIKEATPDAHDYTIINPTFTDVDTEYLEFDPTLDTVTTLEDLPYLTPDIELHAPLTYSDALDARVVTVDATKQDSLGEGQFGSEIRDFSLSASDVVNILENQGYYSTSEGQNYFMLDLYFSDRLTGDIYLEKHPVFLDDNVPVDNPYSHFGDAIFNGVQDLGGSDDPTIDSALLWATLTDGQLTLTDDALALQEEEEEAAMADVL